MNGGSVFVERNNLFLTPKLGQERCMRFVSATGLSHGSHNNGPDFDGHRWVTKFMTGKNRFGANVLKKLLDSVNSEVETGNLLA
jgi:hypothetical protein